ncbi:outer membrane lipoprotein carrier protein LolA [Roseomonas sp. PWR1]|uniref:Outer membrane lipoprotein carrier protein LolA n=1 Tax=Roseomonas nitratireducens TaxID=2820810 RepID=A0ABS4AX63_9PROT|nr:outer membrane lipoprotein carrier protein LolA [Neoroseomonas nitratireducens]MBP0465965.1 outer membrane lipoprotein carrier protein LolA [Neoroseomonas nitratireducens]
MTRRALLLAPAILLAAPAVAQQRAPAPPQGAALTDRDRADLARVEAYLNSLGTLRARFLQLAWNGASAEGTAWIWRPGRMRFEYDPPDPMLLVADAGQFLMYDRDLRAPTTLPVGTTPLGVLLRREVRMSGDITVTAVAREGGFLRVTLFRTREPAEGTLTLVFDAETLQLRQWAVVDPQRRETRVTLSRIETGLRFPAGLFQFNDPRFFEPGGFGAPQGPGN